MSTMPTPHLIAFFFFNDTATTEIYTLSLHDALPISKSRISRASEIACGRCLRSLPRESRTLLKARSEEHTSELQSHLNLVCRLLLEKKKRALHPPRRAISMRRHARRDIDLAHAREPH